MTTISTNTDFITTMVSFSGKRQAKMICGAQPDTTVFGHEPDDLYDASEFPVANLDDVECLLSALMYQPTVHVIRGALKDPSARGIRRLGGNRPDATVYEVPRYVLGMDWDEVPLPETVDPKDLQACADVALTFLPPAFQGCDYIVQATGSHGIKPGGRLRLWFWLSRPVFGWELKIWLKDAPNCLDRQVFSANIPIFTAKPVFTAGATEHLPTRLLRVYGDAAVTVPFIKPLPMRGGSSPAEASIEDIASALAVIPNDTQDWGEFNRMCMATWRATGGSPEGYEAFRLWSEKHPAHDELECEKRWNHYFDSPPNEIGAGTLFHMAKVADKEWVQPSHIAPPAEQEFGSEEFPEGFDLVPIVEQHWTDHLTLKVFKDGEKGGPLDNMANAITAFTRAPEWRDSLAYDEFSNRPKLLAPPPWVKMDRREAARSYPRDCHDDDAVMATTWIQNAAIPNMKLSVVKDAWMTVAKHHGYHPVKSYLNAITWDGTKRIDSWLIDHMGAEDTKLHQQFGAKFLISAVARIFNPGCKVDTVLVLEGPQGLKKSQALQALANGWYTDHIPDLTSKDAAIQIQGVWIVEHAEFDKLGRAESNRAKAFISTGTDRFRPPFGTCSEDFPRQCVFAATLNPSSTGYLNDETGARRYWPVLCGVTWKEPGRKVNIKTLTAVRDQLWAEAVVRFQLGENHWLEGDMEAEQTKVTDVRFTSDPWAGRINKAIALVKFVTIGSILENILGIPLGTANKSHQDRVGKVLRAAGWKVGTKRESPKAPQMRGFRNPDPTVLKPDEDMDDNITPGAFPSETPSNGVVADFEAHKKARAAEFDILMGAN